MPEFQINVYELATLLAIVATAAAAAMIGCWVWCAIRQHKLAPARDAFLAATMLLLAATVFFNQQRPRRLEYNPGRTAIERLSSGTAARRETRHERSRQVATERQRREAYDERQRRAREAAERKQFLETMTATREAR